jgi:hypothetical protein
MGHGQRVVNEGDVEQKMEQKMEQKRLLTFPRAPT